MIETIGDLERFQLENIDGDWIIHLVPVEYSIHPADNKPSVLFIRNLVSGKTYYYSFDHPDSIPQIDRKIFIDSLVNDKIKWCIDKKGFDQLLPMARVYDANLCGYLISNEVEEIEDYETSGHILVRRHANSISQVNRIIPLVKHLEMFDNIADMITRLVRRFKIDSSFLKINDVILPTLGEIEKNGIFVDSNIFQKHFNQLPNSNGYVFSQYNVFTSTGRPSNRYGGINYAALNTSDGSRSAFVSRYGNDGKMVMIDYTAFHPRIICYLTKYNIPIDVDIYQYLAKLYFNKKIVDVNDIIDAKQLTFRQLYGGVDDKYSHIKYLSSLKKYINELWEFFKEHNYISTPIFNRKIKSEHIKEPSPTKIFNYILQAIEGELAIPKIQEVLSFLNGRKTKAVMYTYDAILYDFHKDDGINVLNEICRIMNFDNRFPIKTYIGNSYGDMKIIHI